jgi:D-alanyl-D-alanine carboxypeptidase
MNPAPATPSLDAAALRAWLHRHGIGAEYARTHALRRVREPQRLAPIGDDIHGRVQWLSPRAARTWMRMRAAASRDGVELQAVSAFRSIAYQCGIVERKLARGQTIDAILTVNAAPGYSEHHSGRALDITTPGSAALEEAFEDTAAFAWLCTHAARFGFALSYPRGNRHGIAYEPWHWCWHA